VWGSADRRYAREKEDVAEPDLSTKQEERGERASERRQKMERRYICRSSPRKPKTRSGQEGKYAHNAGETLKGVTVTGNGSHRNPIF